MKASTPKMNGKRRNSSARPTIDTLETRMMMYAGGLDISFGVGGESRFNLGSTVASTSAAALEADGKTVMVGRVGTTAAIIRLNNDGSKDTTFGPNHDGTVLSTMVNNWSAVELQPDGKIVTASNETVARFDSNGQLDTTFGHQGTVNIDFSENFQVKDLLVQGDGKILAAGDVYTYSANQNEDNMGVSRLNADGSFDTSFNGSGEEQIDFGGIDNVVSVFHANGKILLVGNCENPDFNPQERVAMVRLTDGGNLDYSFDNDGKFTATDPDTHLGSASAAFLQADGKILIAGTDGSFTYAASPAVVLARFNANGGEDTSFGPDRNGWVVQATGGPSVYPTGIIQSNINTNIDSNTPSKGIIVAADIITAGQPLAQTTGRLFGFTANGTTNKDFGSLGQVQMPTDVTPAALLPGPGLRFEVIGTPTLSSTTGEPTSSTFYAARFLDAGANQISVGVLNPTAHESGSQTATFEVSRNENLPFPTRVFLDVGGTANPPNAFPARFSDYSTDTITYGRMYTNEPTYIDIPAYQTTAFVTLTPKDDGVKEPTETATFTVRVDPHYERSADASFSATLTIVNHGATSLSATADAYTQSGTSAGTNFGAAGRLLVNSTSGVDRVTYLKFDLTTVTTFTSAKLRLYGGLGGAGGTGVKVDAYAVTSSNWSEFSVNYKNRPALSGKAVASQTVSGYTPAWYELDLTGYLKAQKAAGHNIVTVALHTSTATATYATFGSREASNGPQLVLS